MICAGPCTRSTEEGVRSSKCGHGSQAARSSGLGSGRCPPREPSASARGKEPGSLSQQVRQDVDTQCSARRALAPDFALSVTPWTKEAGLGLRGAPVGTARRLKGLISQASNCSLI